MACTADTVFVADNTLIFCCNINEKKNNRKQNLTFYNDIFTSPYINSLHNIPIQVPQFEKPSLIYYVQYSLILIDAASYKDTALGI